MKVVEEAAGSPDSGLVVVLPRGIRVEIAREFDASTLVRVLSTLEAA